MADYTVRAIFEAIVSGAQKGMRDFGSDVDKAGKKVEGLEKDLKTLDKVQAKPKIDVELAQAEKKVRDVQAELGRLHSLEVTPQVTADITAAEKRLADAEAELRALQGAKAEMVVTADTTPAEQSFDTLPTKARGAGDEAGGQLTAGIAGALKVVGPIASAALALGGLVGGALVAGMTAGFGQQQTRSVFAARTGLDPATARVFGAAAGEAYADAWGDSVEENLDTARRLLQAGLIDETASRSQIERIVSMFAGQTDLIEADMTSTVEAAAALVNNRLAPTWERALDMITVGYQQGADRSEDMLDTLREYPAMFASLGLSGDQALGLIVQGMEAGARSSDLVADGLKEFSIRIQDESATTKEALDAIGLGYDDIVARIATGGPTAAEGLQLVLDGLRGMEDPIARNVAGVALFGTQWEDLGNGAGILALDLNNLGAAFDDTAGAADRAMQTMSDNTATNLESAKRNIQLAVDGITGALADAFGDDVDALAKWVERNRGPVMEFLTGMVNGILDFGRMGIQALAGLTDGIGTILGLLPELIRGLENAWMIFDKITPGSQGWAEGGEDVLAFADSIVVASERTKDLADTMRTEWVGALDHTQDAFNEWVGPAIMEAHVHDAVVAATERLEELSAAIDATGGTITINGNQVPAEQAWQMVVDNINAATGTVTINGQTVPADQALDTLIREVDASQGVIAVSANTSAAYNTANLARSDINAMQADIDVYAETQAAIAAADDARRAINQMRATMKVDSYVIAPYAGAMGGRHDGGWVLPGRNTGGWVPGSNPGYDNVLWPVLPGKLGGGFLNQPLTGGEFVMNPVASANNAALLEFLNAGGSLGGSFPDTMGITGKLDIGGYLVDIIDGRLTSRDRALVRSARARGVA